MGTGDDSCCDARRQIARQVSQIELKPLMADVEMSKENTLKLPLDLLPSLGIGFSEVSQAVHAALQPSGTHVLYRAVLPNGVVLKQAKNGLFSSAARTMDGGAAWAQFQQVSTVQNIAAYFNPTSLAMAAALAQITWKLDAIQETQEEMFDYLRQKDKAVLLGNMQTLTGLFNDYRYNWNNDMWLKNAHMKVLDIKQESDKNSVHLRAQISGKLGSRGPLEIRAVIDQRLDEVLDQLKDYQLATHLYAFASFLEPLLSANYDGAYLATITKGISERALQYRETYSECYNEIERESKGAVDSILLGGVSAVGQALGGLIASTPLGATEIDDSISSAGKSAGRLNEDITEGLMAKLRRAKSPDVLVFQQALDSIDKLYNKPVEVLIDSENIYVIQEAS